MSTCQSCDGHDLVVLEGLQVCTDCGLTNDAFLDMKPHWSTEHKLFTDTSLTTLVGKASGLHNHRLQRIQQWNSATPREREMRQTVQAFEQIQAALSLSTQIVDTAITLYNDVLTKITEVSIYKCKRRTGLRAAAVFFACKESGFPRQRQEIARSLKMPLKNVTKCCNLYLDLMGQSFREKPPLTATDFVDRYCALLGVCDRNFVLSIVAAAEDLKILKDKTPTSVASACILFAINHIGLPILKGDVQSKCGNSSAILTRSYATLLKHQDTILQHIPHIKHSRSISPSLSR